MKALDDKSNFKLETVAGSAAGSEIEIDSEFLGALQPYEPPTPPHTVFFAAFVKLQYKHCHCSSFDQLDWGLAAGYRLIRAPPDLVPCIDPTSAGPFLLARNLPALLPISPCLPFASHTSNGSTNVLVSFVSEPTITLPLIHSPSQAK